MNNPLLALAADPHALPDFSNIQPAHVKPAVESAIQGCKDTIKHILTSNTQFTWQNLVLALEEKDDELERLWAPVSHLNSVMNSQELRDAYESCLPLISEYGTFVGQHEGLCNAYQQLKDSAEYTTLADEQKKVIDDALRDFRLSGIDLPDDKKQRYGEIVMKLSELGSTFSNNVLDATLGWTKHITDEAALSGLPDSAIAAAKHAAEAKELDGWLFTLEFPSYLPVMSYSDNRELREEMYRAFCTRASDQGPNAGKWDNSAIMQETMALRHELANLLGFSDYSEQSLATKMAESPEQVLQFLNDLATKSKAQGEAELKEIHDFAKQNHDMSDLKAWDLGYYAEKLKQDKYAISDEELRPYFPEQRVISGLFETVQRLFGITIKQRSGVDVWHESVRFYDIFDESNELRGSFYFDLYARENKRGGAWMDDCVSRRRNLHGDLQKPVAFLTCNFNKPIGGKPALFTHDEVITLFHEFGHGIHHMLTKVEAGAVSGINGVPWDAVELPSQFLENWCWEPEALAFISGHYETNEPLPEEMLNKMLAAKNFQAAMGMLRQLEFSIFDFRIHREYNAEKGIDIQATLDDVRADVAVIKVPDFNRFQHSFGHIFAGGYSAGYYSYKWAEVLSADAYSKFEEDGIFNKETGRAFLHNILEKGGAYEPMELFTAFRGREPQIDALLRHSGIEAA
ncbi:oligopeptidase A [Flocculibacter collagenilyticus]|uniref:oligopeptidase A n=1 Tax=Flocculibacter collagenilyticus TaxID=2744479 RepID=UPI0018F4E498|nr:oligopeptidase A [Flocculibacter collagenilyticus]